MNVGAVNRGFVDRFERNAPYDFYVFYPHYVSIYNYRRGLDGHIVDIDDSEILSHSIIRSFVDKIINDSILYRDLHAAYTKQSPDGKVYEFNDKKLVVRHLRGDWSTVSSSQDINVYFSNPLFGTTSIDVPHNMYMCWVGGYQRNRVYYGDLIVPVARKLLGPVSRNDSKLPVHVVRGVLTPNRMNASVLICEDWLETRREYRDADWTEVSISMGSLDAKNRYRIEEEEDYGKYRYVYTDSISRNEEVLYFELASDQNAIVTIKSVPSDAESIRLEEYRSCVLEGDYDDY